MEQFFDVFVKPGKKGAFWSSVGSLANFLVYEAAIVCSFRSSRPHDLPKLRHSIKKPFLTPFLALLSANDRTLA